MRLYLVIDESSFYLPNFVARFLERTNDTVVGAALIKKISPKSSINLYLMSHWYYLHLHEIIKLILERWFKALGNTFAPKRRGGNFYSCRSVFEFYGIEYTEIEYTLNKPRYLENIRKA